MKLVKAEHFRFGTIRQWHHAERGRIDTVSSWLQPGAVIIELRPHRSKAERQRRKVLRDERRAACHLAEIVPLRRLA
jgi:hypothetical protein